MKHGFVIMTIVIIGNDSKTNSMNIEKEILAAQREIIQGYYIKIFNQNPTIEIILQWLEDDLKYLLQEDAVETVKDITNPFKAEQKPTEDELWEGILFDCQQRFDDKFFEYGVPYWAIADFLDNIRKEYSIIKKQKI